jgi:hypothetical protein
MKDASAMITAAIMNIQAGHVKALEQFNQRVKMLVMLKAEGIDLMTSEWNLNSWVQRIDRKDLPTLRRLFGRLKVTANEVPYDYAKTQEIVVHVVPMKEEFSNLKFTYRKPYKGDGKCKIVEQVSKYQTLVCTK